MLELGPQNARCHVLTRREGLMSAVGHDLKILVVKFSLRLDDDGTLTGTFDPGSLVVLGSMNAGRLDDTEPGTRDRAQIERTIRDEILDVKKHPRIEVSAKNVTRDASAIDLTLSLHGTTRQVRASVTRHGPSVVTAVTLHQPDFGIRPYSAMLGTLKIKPDVVVEIEVPSLG